MQRRAGERRVDPAWWTLVLFLVIGLLVFLSLSLFRGTFRSFVPVTLESDRAGLVMDPGGKVKMRGVQVGRVDAVHPGTDGVTLKLQLFPDQAHKIPANVQAQIRATTAFGAKYVDLLYPENPSPARLRAGSIIDSQNVSTEVNTVFGNLTELLQQVDPAKLNSVLGAFADGLRGQGERIGEATTAANEVLLQLNPRAEVIRRDWNSLRAFSDTYGVAAGNIVKILDSFSTTSTTVADNSEALDALLLNVTGMSNSGTALLGPNVKNISTAINALEPTTNLLLKYSPTYTCILQGGTTMLEEGGWDIVGGNGKSVILDVALLAGENPYKYPENLPIVAAKGGPGGKPSCGSLPDAKNNFPVRQLVTNTGWGTGLDWRPNPGIGFPGWANYFPTTRGIPEPPSVRYQEGGPAPGPIPYPGAPPYGAPLYAPDGTPLYPGLPPAPPPGAPRDPGPTAGLEPFVPAHPGQAQPTPRPHLPQQESGQ
ncbi:MCE family protein [Mycolicibacterium confluentis]|uniref:Virulence factor n=1 Tax=Mycolicibacterium confluentis TaxID=28047 RepID=A0A7I7Y533_9MYCO|nr:MCE family protein [Mycolicibacterium confluentis]MCV7319173.1 MCE family protein [Mycolicibacterium confluentis]ORV24885.1 MCE-family protein MCE3A [Mycolicibacterium confluentis]BBZ36787.1 virulence factor [Mycolicibacterium confluentis]